MIHNPGCLKRKVQKNSVLKLRRSEYISSCKNYFEQLSIAFTPNFRKLMILCWIGILFFLANSCAAISFRDRIIDRKYTALEYKYTAFCRIDPSDINVYGTMMYSTSKNRIGTSPTGPLKRDWYLDSYDSFLQLCNKELVKSGNFVLADKSADADYVMQFKVHVEEFANWYALIGMITLTLVPIIQFTNIKISGELYANKSHSLLAERTLEHRLIQHGSLIPNPLAWLIGSYYRIVSGHWWKTDGDAHVQLIIRELMIDFSEYLKTHPLDTSSRFPVQPVEKEEVPKAPAEPEGIRM